MTYDELCVLKLMFENKDAATFLHDLLVDFKNGHYPNKEIVFRAELTHIDKARIDYIPDELYRRVIECIQEYYSEILDDINKISIDNIPKEYLEIIS